MTIWSLREPVNIVPFCYMNYFRLSREDSIRGNNARFLLVSMHSIAVRDAKVYSSMVYMLPQL